MPGRAIRGRPTSQSPAPAQISYERLAALNTDAGANPVCRTHGIVGRFTPYVWLGFRRTALQYPEAVTLTAEASTEDVFAGSTSPMTGLTTLFS